MKSNQHDKERNINMAMNLPTRQQYKPLVNSLVLLCDSAEEPEQFSQLEGAAQAVAKATGNMAAVASRYVRCRVH